jgi:hypothetical protein
LIGNYCNSIFPPAVVALLLLENLSVLNASLLSSTGKLPFSRPLSRAGGKILRNKNLPLSGRFLLLQFDFSSRFFHCFFEGFSFLPSPQGHTASRFAQKVCAYSAPALGLGAGGTFV